ncbi:MAG: hypothetical protein AAF367_18865 [Pseudomonadota bacterium]
MNGAMPSLLEFASYMPPDSKFTELVKEIHGLERIPERISLPVVRAFQPRDPLEDLSLRMDRPSHDDEADTEALDQKIKELDALSTDSDLHCLLSDLVDELREAAKDRKELEARALKAELDAKCKAEKLPLKARIASIVDHVIKSAVTAFIIVTYIENTVPGEEVPDVYYVSTKETHLNVRSDPDNLSTDPVGRLERKQRVFIIQEFDNSYEIDCQKTGVPYSGKCYVDKRYLKRFRPPRNTRSY